MWELSSVLDQCVKCSSKFTSSEKPLKLLPCLHSMCLDCLYGRTPVPVKTTTENIGESKEKDDSKQTSVGEQDYTTDKSVTDQSKSEDDVTKSKDVTEDKSCSSSDKDLSLVDDVEKENNDTEMQYSGSEERQNVISDEATKPSEDKSEELPPKENSENSSSATANEIEDSEKAEVPDIKPTPAKECPLCREPITQPPTALMDNLFATLDVTETSSSDVDTSHVCTGCEEGQEANSYCVQCEEWLCDSCVDAHKRVRVTKDHVISPKDQVSSATSKTPSEQQMTCKQHRQEQLKFFCEKCETMTCRDCQLMDHKDHKYQFLDQAAEQYKARLKGSLALMGEKRSKLSTSREEIEQKLLNCKEQKDTVQTDILRQADILVKKIRQAVWGVLSGLASFTDAATKRLNKEIEDVSDLIYRFDHCIHFMEDILKQGTSMSLLFSKGNVEAKCRKVYHTQVDPQSLKGNLLIRYKHDVNWLLNNLSKIGAIFVNGVRYPPEKAGQHGQHQHQQNGPQYQQDHRSGLSGSSPHLQHLANQAVPGQRTGDEWTKFIQAVSKPVAVNQLSSQSAGPPNMSLAAMGGNGNSLPPQLTLPSRRVANTGVVGHSWTGVSGSNFPGQFSQVMSQQHPPQHMVQPSRPSFTPMRLHHRPAATHPSSFASQSDRGSGNMRSPPNYRIGGGEASGSSGSTSSRSSHGTPDPARPASAGMYDGNSRPDSGGGGVPSMVDIKKERRDQSPDCIITSTSLRSEKQNLFQTSPMGSRVSETIMEMQRNLDDVIRAVPMDPSDNLEQISGSRSLTEETNHSNSQKLNSSSNPVVAFPNIAQNLNSKEEPKSPTDEELRENWQGGNSMPGFSIPSNLQVDPNDDYCACCHNGGNVLCCDTCPRVFHLQCHIPEITSVPSGSFLCTICEGDKPVEHEEFNSLGKRKAGLSENDVKVCERTLLDLFCHPSSIPFHEPVNKEHVPNYDKIITQPKDFTQIKFKLKNKNGNSYQSLKGFLYDMRQVFINCAIYNKETSEVGKAGKMVRELFESIVAKLMPQYLEFVKENPTPCFSALQRQADPDLVEGEAATTGTQSGGQGGEFQKTVMQPEENGDQPSSPKRMKVDTGGE